MSDLDRQVDLLTQQIKELSDELKGNGKDSPAVDRVTQIEEELTVKAAAIEEIVAKKRNDEVDARLRDLDQKLKDFQKDGARTKAAAILAGASSSYSGVKAIGEYSETNWLSALVARRNGDQDAAQFVKGVLGTSTATGLAVVPNNFVDSLVRQIALVNPYRGIFEVVSGVSGAAVDIPYEITAITAALVQGAYGSNKDVRDFSFNKATATLYTIAQIADVGNQLLRQSNGAAESDARNRLAGSIGMTEATWVTNGTGTGQPLGFFQAFLAFGDPAAFKTALTSEARVAAIGRGFSALEGRGVQSTNLVVAMHPTDYWELAVETLGTSGSGGWALDPAAGAAAFGPVNQVWGVPIIRDANWPTAQVGTALIIDKSAPKIYTGQEYRIDVSSEAGSRFDQNVTGFRAEEEFAFNAEPYVRTGRVQKVTGV